MRESKNEAAAYLSVRKASGKLVFYAVRNRWNPQKKSQDKIQIYLGSLKDGAYRFNANAARFEELLLASAHRDGYRLFRQNSPGGGQEGADSLSTADSCQAGIGLLMQQIARDSRLWDYLCSVFGEEKAKKILSLAYYVLALTPISLSRAQTWSAIRQLPCPDPLTPELIKQLFHDMDAASIRQFLHLWLKTSSKNNRLAFLLTPVSSFTKSLTDPMHGMHRDTKILPKLNLVMIVDQSTLMPLWFSLLPDSYSDADTINATLETLRQLDDTPAHMVLDRSFASEKIAHQLLRRGAEVTLDVPLWRFAELEALLEQAKREHLFDDPGATLAPFQRFDWTHTKCVTKLLKLDSRRINMHYYFTQQYRDQADEELMLRIEQLRRSMECGYPLTAADRKTAELCLVEKNTGTGGRKYVKNMRAIRQLMDDNAGYFVIASSQFSDPFEAMIACELRDAIECFFNDLKNNEDCHRINVYMPQNLSARLLIQFVAQCLRSRMRWRMNQRKGYLSWGATVSGTLNEVDSLRMFLLKDGSVRYGRPTATQQEIFEFFGVTIPQAGGQQKPQRLAPAHAAAPSRVP